LTLATGLEELAQAPVLGSHWFTGLADTRRLLREAGDAACDLQALAAFDAQLEHACATPPATLIASWRCVVELAARAQALQPATLPDVQSPDATQTDDGEPTAADDAAHWVARLVHQSAGAREELAHLAPWIADSSPGSAADIPVPSL